MPASPDELAAVRAEARAEAFAEIAADNRNRARIAAHTRWAKEPDRTAATESARRGLEAKFEREVDPDGVLSPAERAKRVENYRKAHYARLALKSAQARRKRAAAKSGGAA